MSKQPRMPRRNYNTRLREVTSKLSVLFVLCTAVNLAVFALAVSQLNNSLTLPVMLYTASGALLSISAMFVIRNF